MALYYIDSNIFFYAKIQDRAYGKPCSKIVREIAQGKRRSAVSNLILLEVANALRKYGFADEAKRTVDAIFSLEITILGVENQDVHEATLLFDKYRISPYDCIHAATMKRSSIQTIISADKDYDKIPWLKRINPRTVHST